MPKSRGRKNGRSKRDRRPSGLRTVPTTPRVEGLMKRQLEAFRKKFGRDPGPSDPVFFDPNEDEPTPIDGVQEQILAAMEKAKLPPEFAYAYRKTGLLGLRADKSAWPREHVAEWNAAIDEYRADEQVAKRLELSLEDAHRWRHSQEHPGFEGELEFGIEFALLGHQVERRVRAEYKFTPDWEYYDLEKRQLFTGWMSLTYGMSLLTVADEPDPDEEVVELEGLKEDPDDPRAPAWVKLDLMRDGMLPRQVWNRIYDLIDEKCQAEDQARRRKLGLL
jgi:hypothetical protein